MGALAQLSHRTEILFLFRCETVEANAEEALIERSHGCDGSCVNGVDIDRRCQRRQPSVTAPLLQEVRVALRDLQNLDQCPFGDRHALVLKWFLDCEAGCGGEQRSDHGEIKQAFGIRLGVAHLPAQLGQTCADQNDGQLPLLGPMYCRDKGRQLRLLHVLQLVDEDRQGRVGRFGGQADLLKQRLQVVLKIAVVSQARFGLVVDTHLDIAESNLELAGETRQRTQTAHGVVFRGCDLAQAQQGLTQLRCDQRRKRTPFGRLDADRVESGRLGIHPDAVQQYRLANPAQANQHGALGWATDPGALERNAQGFAQVATAGKFRWRSAGSGGKGIADRVHAAKFILRFAKLPQNDNFGGKMGSDTISFALDCHPPKTLCMKPVWMAIQGAGSALPISKAS